jgi:lipopolysaccharide export system protein LptA
MYRCNNIRLILCRMAVLAGVLLHAPAGLSANGNTEADIQIQANYMKFDMATGSSTYQGDVKISQGSIVLSGDTVVITRQQDEIQQININGQPARYMQDEDSKNKIHASSQHMQYFASENRLVMTVDARLQQPDHTIESQRIVYDTKNKIVVAGDDEQGPESGRVNITLTPKKDNSTTPANTEKP